MFLKKYAERLIEKAYRVLILDVIFIIVALALLNVPLAFCTLSDPASSRHQVYLTNVFSGGMMSLLIPLTLFVWFWFFEITLILACSMATRVTILVIRVSQWLSFLLTLLSVGGVILLHL